MADPQTDRHVNPGLVEPVVGARRGVECGDSDNGSVDMRCGVCGRLMTEECNARTHAVHDRLWRDDALFVLETSRGQVRPRSKAGLEADKRLTAYWAQF